MKEIVMSQGFVTWVDDDVFEWAKYFTWTPHKDRGVIYAVRHYRDQHGKLLRVILHREIMNPRHAEV